MGNRLPRVVIAALRGGAGKTTLAIGLIAAWRERAGRVVPFKKGPDYIDAGWLALAAGQPCYNLDPFLMNQGQILGSFRERTREAVGAVIEGNRGLYDGMDAAGTCSTAALAKVLRAPVLLVFDATKMTRTAAAAVLGCQHFDPEVRIRGVILNRVAGARHEEMLRTTIEQHCGIPVVGAVPKVTEEAFPERHMGLMTALEHPEAREAVLSRIRVVDKYIDLDQVIALARQAPPLSWEGGLEPRRVTKAYRQPIIGVIRDSAFQFYYPENLEALEARGARVVEVNALHDEELPALDALYIGGGFPETHAERLAANRRFSESLRSAIELSLPVYAECGGLMYLGRNLLVGDRTYPMVGVLPMDFKLMGRPQGHGYTMVEVVEPNPFYPVGLTLRGHEFHYSRVDDYDTSGLSMAFTMRRGIGILDGKDGVCYRNTLAAYSHIHAVGSPEWAEGMVRAALAHQRRKEKNLDQKKGNTDPRANVGASDGVH
jgi:cobyrinic acid a,c-diamide synthase